MNNKVKNLCYVILYMIFNYKTLKIEILHINNSMILF